MANEKKVSISHRTVACYKCDYEMVTTGGGVVNGWLPMSRRERRRARKAAKNLAMFKTYGRRPWTPSDKSYFRRARPMEDHIAHSLLAWRFERTDGDYAVLRMQMRARHAKRIGHLREPSGFKAMSSLADAMKPRPRWVIGVDFGSEPAFTVVMGPDGKVVP